MKIYDWKPVKGRAFPPVDPDTLVRVRLRGGKRFLLGIASRYNWGVLPDPRQEIVQYQIVGDDYKPPRPWYGIRATFTDGVVMHLKFPTAKARREAWREYEGALAISITELKRTKPKGY